jgi:RimJ/RimL family protein N-acetyltransferase
MPNGMWLHGVEMMSVSLRPLQPDDCELLFLWRNDPFIVTRSSNRMNVAAEDHHSWFGKLLVTKDSLPFIIEVDDKAVGHIRFDRTHGVDCFISVYLLESHTKRGYGIEAIRQGCSLVGRNWPNMRVIAEVRRENYAGQVAFTKVGFEILADAKESSTEIIRFCYRCPSMEEQETKDIYQNLYRRFGNSYQTLNWGSAQSQALRFEVLSQVGKITGSKILDVGCGLGDMVDWLERRGIEAEYVGLELTDNLVEGARRRFPDRRFVNGSVTDPTVLRGERFDFVLASGIFATYPVGGAPWMEQIVSRMWDFAGRGVAFNSLSSWAPQPDPGEYYADPERVIKFCRTLTPLLQLRHDYHPRDFTVFLYREIET